MLPPLRQSFDALESRRKTFLAELGACPPEQLEFHPAPGVWSLTDVARHLSQVDRGTARVLTERRVTGVARRTVLDVVYRAPALAFYLRSGLIRARVPVKSVIPDASMTLADAAAAWERARASLAAYLDTIEEAALPAIVYRHPFGGFMDIGATLGFLQRHHDHHMRQTARIRRAPGFPAATAPGGRGTAPGSAR